MWGIIKKVIAVIKTTFSVNTPSAINITINSKSVIIDSNELIAFQEKEYFDGLCKKVCPNYNYKWSCPPCSPSYSDYKNGFPKALLVLFYCNLDQFHYIKTEYMKVKASNSILRSRLDRLMRELEIKYTGKMLTNGSCRLCKTCNKKNSLPCKKPFEMRYSMEALGLNVDKITQHFFGHRLMWYKDKKAPSYSSAVSCLLTNELPAEEEIIFELKKLALT